MHKEIYSFFSKVKLHYLPTKSAEKFSPGSFPRTKSAVDQTKRRRTQAEAWRMEASQQSNRARVLSTGSESSRLDSDHSSTIHCISWAGNVCLLLFPCKLIITWPTAKAGGGGGGVHESKVDICVKDIRRGPVVIPSIIHHCLCSFTSLSVFLICLLWPPFQ